MTIEGLAADDALGTGPEHSEKWGSILLSLTLVDSEPSVVKNPVSSHIMKS